MKAGDKVKITTGTYKGCLGQIREIRGNSYYLDVENHPELTDIGWVRNEIELLT